MLFFGGFSSVIPYVVYLLLVWICLIISLRGRVKEIFHSSSPDKSEVIGTFCHVFDEKIIQYYKYDRKQDNRTEQIALFPKENKLCIFFKEKINRSLYEACYFNNSYISESYKLRGPPLLSVLKSI